MAKEMSKKELKEIKDVVKKNPPKNGKKNRTVDEWVNIAEQIGTIHYKYLNKKESIKNVD